MALWTGCVLHKPDMFEEFVSRKDTEDFVLGGLLFCPEEKINLDFQNTFSSLSKHFLESDNRALIYLLGLQAKNFGLIADHPARQFFDLFNELIDLHAERDWENEIYNPEELLVQIIGRIKKI